MQLSEIINIIDDKYSGEDIFVLTNVLLSNGDADCVIITKNGPIILELKDYYGEIIGTENGEWFVRKDETKIPLSSNLFQQLKNNRNDLYKKLDKIRENYFPRIESEDLRKINAWGYFGEGSSYSDYQMNLKSMPWFSVVTKEDLAKKMRFQNTGYTFTLSDMEHIIQGLNVEEWTDDMLNSINSQPSKKSFSNIDPVQSNNIESIDIIDMLDKMAQNGHAPEDGCILFGIGNEEKINLINNTYLEKNFKRGSSAENSFCEPLMM